MVFQTLLNLILWALSPLTTLFWTSETSSTVELGMCTGTSEPAKKKPPKKRKLVEIPAVLYIEHGSLWRDYWDARMTDVSE